MKLDKLACPKRLKTPGVEDVKRVFRRQKSRKAFGDRTSVLNMLIG